MFHLIPSMHLMVSHVQVDHGFPRAFKIVISCPGFVNGSLKCSFFQPAPRAFPCAGCNMLI